MSDSPPLNAVRVFVCAARLGSFKAAASALFVTPGAVSRQIQALEAHLGVALFERRFREVALTQMGELYLAQVQPALLRIDGASRKLREFTRPAVVRVDSTPTFAMYWLIPRLARFRNDHPGIEVRLTTSQGVIDLRRDPELFIRRDPAQFGPLAGEGFMTEYSQLVCSPRVAGWRNLRTAADILAAPRIAMRSRQDLWPQWLALRAGGEEEPSLPPIEFDNTILAIQAAIEGLGVALVPGLFLDASLAGESLVALPEQTPFASGTYHLLCRRPLSEAAERFAQWIRAEAAEGVTAASGFVLPSQS